MFMKDGFYNVLYYYEKTSNMTRSNGSEYSILFFYRGSMIVYLKVV
jgi:hypothetical protein